MANAENGQNGHVSTAEFAELHRQVERGSLFTQATLQRGFERLSEAERLITTLTMALIAKGVVSGDELGVSVEEDDPDVIELDQDGRPVDDTAMGGGFQMANKMNWPSIAIRVDPEDTADKAPVLVDCAARMHVCHAVCCSLKFPLSGAEIDSGHVKWDIGHPYVIRQRADGGCVHNDPESGHCGVYENRPGVCQRYTCYRDDRIWKDFDNMVLNQEWIDANVGHNQLHVTAVLPAMEEDIS